MWRVFIGSTLQPYSEELLGLRLRCGFGGWRSFGFSGEESHDVLESFIDLCPKPVGVLRWIEWEKNKWREEQRKTIVLGIQTSFTYSLTAGVFGRHMEVDHVLTNDDVRDPVAVISNLTWPQSSCELRVCTPLWVCLWKKQAASGHYCSFRFATRTRRKSVSLTGPNPPPSDTNSGWFFRSNSSICWTGVWLVERRQGSDKTWKVK